MALRNPERLVQIPGVGIFRPEEVLRRIENFVNQCPGMTAVILIGQEGNPGFFRATHTSNLTRSQVREQIRAAQQKLDKQGDIIAPGR